MPIPRVATALVAAALLAQPFVPSADAAPKTRISSVPAAQMTLYATHPMASRTAFDSQAPNVIAGGTYCTAAKSPDADGLCPVGQTITDMNVGGDGSLVAGYGDWNYNADSFTVPAGRVAAVPLDLATGTWGAATLLGTEAFDVVRRAPDGSLWVPMTDPSNHSVTGSGVATNRGGAWRTIADGQGMYHTFDVAVGGDGAVWAFGARNAAGVGPSGVAARSSDQGRTWQTAFQYRDASVGDASRFYAGAVTARGTVVTGLAHVTGTFIFDGAAWKSDPAQVHTKFPKLLERFADGYVYAKTGAPRYVSASSERVLAHPSGIPSEASVTDLYVDFDGALFYLAGGSVVRVDPGTLKSRIVATGVTGTSIVVHGGRIYAGSTKGQIYRSAVLDTLAAADATAAPARGKSAKG